MFNRFLSISLIAVLSCLGLTSCGGGGGGDSKSSSSCNFFKVINGEECRSDSLPIVRLEIFGTQGNVICTGTIASQDTVLTAAHCVFQASRVIAVHDRGSIEANSATLNPLWFTQSSSQRLPAGALVNPAFDVAVVNFPGIANLLGLPPVDIELSNAVKAGDQIDLVGFGEDGTGQPLINGNPRGTSIRVEAVEDGMIFSRFNSTNSGACRGDSGGGVFASGRLVGFVSGGANNCGAGNLSWFAWAQNQGNYDFIRSTAPQVNFR